MSKRKRRRTRERHDVSGVSIIPPPVVLQRGLGPPTGRLGGGSGGENTHSHNRRRRKKALPICYLTHSSALQHTANCLLTSPQGDEVKSVCGCASESAYVCVRFRVV